MAQHTHQPPKSSPLGSDAPLPAVVARAILDGFETHYRAFNAMAAQSKINFENCRWKEQDIISQERLSVFDKTVDNTIINIKSQFNFQSFDRDLWEKIKTAYINLIFAHNQPELAETFYNSIFCRLFTFQLHYNSDYLFFKPAISTDYIDIVEPVSAIEYTDCPQLPVTLAKIFTSLKFNCDFEDIKRDTQLVADRIISQLQLNKNEGFEIHYIHAPFVRQKSAYLIGQIKVGSVQRHALAIAFCKYPDRQLHVDAVVTDVSSLANIFSFARSYFFISTQFPASIVSFIQELIPFSTKADIYSAIGLHKQGKNLLYRLFVRKSLTSSEKLESSPGVKGMVMTVFGGASYPYVYKVINDNFAPPKTVTNLIVKQKYQFVKRHPKLGRMADTWEFSNVAFPRHKFTDAFFEEMQSRIRSKLLIKDDIVFIKHLYMENKMIPLNLYLQQADEAAAIRVSRDFCQSIIDLIEGGIFPGDMLTKNFGVTGQGRVIFYDYDEITTIDTPVFRPIPEPRTLEEEYAAEPWYAVGENDVFPEEFAKFMATNKILKQVYHSEYKQLGDYRYWQDVQQNYTQLMNRHYYPYEQKFRLKTGGAHLTEKSGGG